MGLQLGLLPRLFRIVSNKEYSVKECYLSSGDNVAPLEEPCIQQNSVYMQGGD